MKEKDNSLQQHSEIKNKSMVYASLKTRFRISGAHLSFCFGVRMLSEPWIHQDKLCREGRSDTHTHFSFSQFQ